MATVADKKKELAALAYQKELQDAVSGLIYKVGAQLPEQMAEPELRTFLSEAYALHKSEALTIIHRAVTQEMMDFITAESKNFDEVVAHRAVILAVQSIKGLILGFAQQHANLMEDERRKPSDIIPNV